MGTQADPLICSQDAEIGVLAQSLGGRAGGMAWWSHQDVWLEPVMCGQG